jgi:hypothetical protein
MRLTSAKPIALFSLLGVEPLAGGAATPGFEGLRKSAASVS